MIKQKNLTLRIVCIITTVYLIFILPLIFYGKSWISFTPTIRSWTDLSDFFSILSSVVGALTLVVIWMTLKVNKIELDEIKQQRIGSIKPHLLLNIENHEIIYDNYSSTVNIQINKKENIEPIVELTNIGKDSAIDVKFNYIFNIHDIKNTYDLISQQNFESTDYLTYNNYQRIIENAYFMSTRSIDGIKEKIKKGHKSAYFFPFLNNKTTERISLPMFYVDTVGLIVFLNSILPMKFDYPELKIELQYKDIDYRSRNIVYTIKPIVECSPEVSKFLMMEYRKEYSELKNDLNIELQDTKLKNSIMTSITNHLESKRYLRIGNIDFFIELYLKSEI